MSADDERIKAMGGVARAWQNASKLEEAANIINSCLSWANTPEHSNFWGDVHSKLTEYKRTCVRLRVPVPRGTGTLLKSSPPGLNDRIKSVDPKTWRMSP